MQVSKQTSTLLVSLDDFSGRRLTRRDDLGTLIELAFRHNQRITLEDLSFRAKFISKAHGIMQRIGTHGEGYDKLSLECTEAIKKCVSLINLLLAEAPTEDRQRFTSIYLDMTPDALHNLLTLCYDLSWYKNWLIDHSTTADG